MRTPNYKKSSIQCNESYEGDTIEIQMRRVLENKEKIEAVSPIIYTAKKDGVQPQYDIRTDRWEIAQNAMNSVDKARRQQAIDKETAKNSGQSTEGGVQ